MSSIASASFNLVGIGQRRGRARNAGDRSRLHRNDIVACGGRPWRAALDEPVDLARIALGRLGLVGKGIERDRRPTQDEIDRIIGLSAIALDRRHHKLPRRRRIAATVSYSL